MDYVESEGDSIDEAIENALKILQVERDKVTVDILAEGTKGILGFGSQKARIRASLRQSLLGEGAHEGPPSEKKKDVENGIEVATQAGKEVLAQILSLMGIRATLEIRRGEDKREITFDIHGDSGGLLIGRKGQTLEALQYLLARILGKAQPLEDLQVIVDTENYRERRRKTLESMALRLGEKAKRQRKTITLDDLSAADRRIIHLTLQDDPWLTTKSLGAGPYRRLLIIPEGDRKRRDEDKVPPARQVKREE